MDLKEERLGNGEALCERLSANVQAALAAVRLLIVAKHGASALPAIFIDDLLAGRAQAPRRASYLRPALYVRGVPSHPWRHAPNIIDVSRGAAIATIIRDEWNKIKDLPNSLTESLNSGVAKSGAWRTLLFKQGNKWNAHAQTLMPRTKAIIEATPRLGELAFLSVLNAGHHIGAHCGPWNLRTNLHLGIQIPPNCGIRVAQTTRDWLEGRWIAFDDCFEHEVWNHSQTERVVLVVNAWNSALTETEISAFSMISGILTGDEMLT